jgi:hypothetical protein
VVDGDIATKEHIGLLMAGIIPEEPLKSQGKRIVETTF